MVVFDKPNALADVPLHYCPGCTHGIIHRLVAEVLDELNIEGDTVTCTRANEEKHTKQLQIELL